MDLMIPLQTALRDAAMGHPVFPLFPVLAPSATKSEARCGCGNPDCGAAGKHPRIKNWRKRATTDPAQIREWWTRWPEAGVGNLTGEIAGFVVLDVDGLDGEIALRELLLEHGWEIPETVTVRTGEHGARYYFKHPGVHVPTTASVVAPHVDIIGDGGAIVQPPSQHWSGPNYTYAPGKGRGEIDYLDMPRWLLDRNAAGASARGQAGFAGGDTIPDGRRTTTLTSIAGSLVNRGASDAVLETTLRALNQTCASPLEDAKLQEILRSARGWGRRFHCTDLGNAERFAARHADDVRYCALWDRWFYWTGTHWAPDEVLYVRELAAEVARAILEEANRCEDKKERAALAAWSFRSEHSARLDAMIKIVRPMLPVHPDTFDQDPWALNVQNGTLDLRTGKLRPHRREDSLTKLAPVAFDQTASCPRFRRFLDEIFRADDALISFVQKLIGYSLTGCVEERIFPILHGRGKNGKSTFVNSVQDMLGTYAVSTPAETIIAARETGIPNDVARLKGVRFVACQETEEGKRLRAARIKAMTGKDTISARFMRGEWFDFRPEFKLWLSTNHRPHVQSEDEALWDRLRLVPFEMRAGEDGIVEDHDLARKLHDELPGILRWAVEGCLRWQREGLEAPEKVCAATRDYRGEEDILGDFLDETCELDGLSTTRVVASVLYNVYQLWCERSGYRHCSIKHFKTQLVARGLQFERIKSGVRWIGIRLRKGMQAPEFADDEV